MNLFGQRRPVVGVIHLLPLPGSPRARGMEEVRRRALADALLVTGPETGRPPERGRLEEVKRAVPDRPALVASGLDPENLSEYAAADGFIVGTALKRGGRTENPVDPARVRRFLAAWRRI